jgi:hypothetical protein
MYPEDEELAPLQQFIVKVTFFKPTSMNSMMMMMMMMDYKMKELS